MTEAEPSDLRLRAVVPAPPKVVYEALTDPAALRVWLAEHAEVRAARQVRVLGPLHAGRRRAAPARAARGRAHHPVRLDRRRCRDHGEFELAEDEDGTLVTLSQSDLPSFEEVLADTAGARGALQTFWSLAIANLADYLSGRELTPKCDFTSAELHASVVIDAAPEEVFDSMTQPEQFRKWFGANVDIEPYVGGRFAMGGFELDPGGAKFVEFEPGRKATPAVRRRRDRQLGAGRLGRQDPAHPGAERVRPRQPAVPGLGRLAGRRRRAAALPRAAPRGARSGARSRSPASPTGMFSDRPMS